VFPPLDTIRRALTTRLDGWFNLMSGVGASNGRAQMSFTVNASEYLGLADCEVLYNFDGVAARVVDSVPTHALRQGFTVSTGEASVETATLDALKSLAAVPMLARAWTWGRLYGGGALLMGVDDGQSPDQPVDEDRIRAVRWLVDLDRRDCYPLTYDRDPDSARFGMPLLYSVTRMGGAASQVMTAHHSRLLRFEGVTPTRRRRLALQGWGDSVLQRCYQELQQMRGAFAASGELVQQASQGVLKMKGLMGMMASDTDDLVKRRLFLMDLSRSVARSILLDADGEDFSRVDAGSLTGVADIMDRMIVMFAGVTETPVTVLMGQAPAGLNATGDSDIRNWYDKVAAERTTKLEPPAARLVKLVLLSKEGPTQGQEPAGWGLKFPPLWQPTPTEAADLRNKQATTDCLYIDKQVLTPEEVALSRFRREGWSDDTSIDLASRQVIVDRDASEGAAGGDGDGADGNEPPGADHAEGIAAVIARVAAREIPRDAGVALLAQSFAMDPTAAEQTMGEAGRTFFTKPDPLAQDATAQELDALKGEHAKLQASARGTSQMLTRVLERNRAGELVVGSVIARAPTDVKPGDALEEGDAIEVPAGTEPAEKTDGDDSVWIALVVPVEPPTHVAGGTPRADLHLTLAFLGPAADLSADQRAKLRDVVTAWARSHETMPATLNGVGRFAGETLDPVYVSPDCPKLAAAREDLVRDLDKAGVPPRTAHGFVPHVTIGYVPREAPTPPPGDPVSFTFNTVSLWFAGEREDFPLASPKSDGGQS